MDLSFCGYKKIIFEYLVVCVSCFFREMQCLGLVFDADGWGILFNRRPLLEGYIE